jgi:hypothetical protein
MNSHLPRFYSGNVIEAPERGGKWIVIRCDDADKSDGVVTALSFDSENCSAVQRLNDHDRNDTCHCESYTGDGEYDGNDPDCERCHGTGSYVVHVKGWKHSKLLAPTVQDFILRGIKRAWKL